MIHMEDSMRIIVEHKNLAEACSPGKATPGSCRHKAAAREQLAEAMNGLELKFNEAKLSSNKTMTDCMAAAASVMAKAVSAAAQVGAESSKQVQPSGLLVCSVEAQLAWSKMTMHEKLLHKAELADQCHQLAVQSSQQQFQLQMQQLYLLKAEMDERTARLMLELERLCSRGAVD